MQDSDGKSCVDRMHRIKMHKEVTVKEDGRLLVYYTFAATAAETPAADKGIGKTDKETSL
ncbi:MAG: hypothetical protein U0105_01690 [Candidatus Obscuribacterales bacterium]